MTLTPARPTTLSELLMSTFTSPGSRQSRSFREPTLGGILLRGGEGPCSAHRRPAVSLPGREVAESSRHEGEAGGGHRGGSRGSGQRDVAGTGGGAGHGDRAAAARGRADVDPVRPRCTPMERSGVPVRPRADVLPLPAVLESIFAAVGPRPARRGRADQARPAVSTSVFGAGGELLATPDVDRMERAIAALAPDDAPQFRRFLADNRVKMEHFRSVLESPFLGWRDLLSPQLAEDAAAAAPLALARRRARPLLPATSGAAGDDVPVEISGHVAVQLPEPVLDPVVPRIRIRRVSSGRRLRRGEPGDGARPRTWAWRSRLGDDVEEILFEGRRAVGVRTRPRACTAADAIVDQRRLRPRHDAARARPPPPALDRREDRAEEVLVLDVHAVPGHRGPLRRLQHHTIYLSRRLPAEPRRHREPARSLPNDPSFYVQNACVTDPRSRPPGNSTLYVLVPVTHQHANVDWSREKDRFRAGAAAAGEGRASRTSSTRIRFEQVVTPADWDQPYEIYRGATFNLAHNLRQMLHLRPRNRFEDLDRSTWSAAARTRAAACR